VTAGLDACDEHKLVRKKGGRNNKQEATKEGLLSGDQNKALPISKTETVVFYKNLTFSSSRRVVPNSRFIYLPLLYA
jgi:hypothetical protein